jgi:ribonuclease Z
LPGLLQTLALSNYSRVLEIYGPKGTRKFLELMLSLFIFREKLKVKVHEIEEGIFFENKDFKLEAWKMKHQAPCLAYAFTEKSKYRIKMQELKKLGLQPGPILQELQNGKDIKFKDKIIQVKRYTTLVPGKKISFIFDTAYNENCVRAAKDADLLIEESTFGKEHEDKAQERQHLTAEQSATIAKKANVKKLLLAHISQRYSGKETIVLEEAKKIFKASELAKDFMKIKV